MQVDKEERHPWRLEVSFVPIFRHLMKLKFLGRQFNYRVSSVVWNKKVDINCRLPQRKSLLLKEEWEIVLRKVIKCVCNNSINRWHNHLDPMVRKSPWNDQEEYVFIESHKVHGNKWAEIAKMIPGR